MGFRYIRTPGFKSGKHMFLLNLLEVGWTSHKDGNVLAFGWKTVIFSMLSVREKVIKAGIVSCYQRS